MPALPHARYPSPVPFRLYNSLTKQVEPFRPADPARITFYTCGPTVYDFAHIGNFRSFLIADVARRWLESPLCELVNDPPDFKAPGFRGREVVHVMNITDVGHMTADDSLDGAGVDRMEEGGRRLLEMKKAGKLPPGAPANLDPNDPYSIAEFYASAFLEDARLLGLKVAIEAEKKRELMPRPTRKIAQMQAMIRELLSKDIAYIVPGSGAPGTPGAPGSAGTAVYFDVRAYDRAGGNYGVLSGNTLDRLRTGAGGRISAANQSGKRDPADFMLWKVDPAHKMAWVFEKKQDEFDAFEKGYPGWHIECSAMAREVFGDTLDLHSGGEDNIFPHHECEIAQSRAASGAPLFARHWLHVRHLQVEGEKMSKSKGNFYTIRDLMAKGFDPAAIRLELIKTHYRSNANFTEQGLIDSQRMIERWNESAIELARRSTGWDLNQERIAAMITRNDVMIGALHDDLNVALLIGSINARISDLMGLPVHAARRSDDIVATTLGACEPITRALQTKINRFDKPVDVLSEFLRPLGVIDAARPRAAKSDDLASSYKSRIEAARAAKNYAESDRLRAEAEGAGYEVRLSRDGATVTKRAAL